MTKVKPDSSVVISRIFLVDWIRKGFLIDSVETALCFTTDGIMNIAILLKTQQQKIVSIFKNIFWFNVLINILCSKYHVI